MADLKRKRWYRLLSGKVKATCKIWSSVKPTASLRLAPDTEARSVATSILLRRLRPQNEQQRRALEATADEILAKIKDLEEMSITERSENLLGGAFGQAFWFHGQLSGLTATWEFQVRLLGVKLGVLPNVPIENKSKENRSKKSVQHRTLSDTISEINRITGHRLNLKLTELSGLRDAVVHCNPQAMKAYSQPVFGKERLKNIRGDVVVMSLDVSKVQNMGDVVEEKEIEEQDLFSWFLEVFNSELPKKAFDRFDESIRSLDLLVGFAALSFGERKTVFDNLVFHGKKPSLAEMEMYQKDLDRPYLRAQTDAKVYFDEISKCFKNLKSSDSK